MRRCLRLVVSVLSLPACGGISASDPRATGMSEPAGQAGSAQLGTGGQASVGGSGGSAGTSTTVAVGATNPTCPGTQNLVVRRKTDQLGWSCRSDRDCSLLKYAICESNYSVVGIPAGAECEPPAPFSCAGKDMEPPVYRTDDGRSSADLSEIAVHCVQGLCLSSSLRCNGTPCPADRVCVHFCTGGETCVTPQPSCQDNKDACSNQMCVDTFPASPPLPNFVVIWYSPSDAYCLTGGCMY